MQPSERQRLPATAPSMLVTFSDHAVRSSVVHGGVGLMFMRLRLHARLMHFMSV